MAAGAATIPVEIELPGDGPESEMADDGAGIRWVLRVSTVDSANASFSAEFEIPVFKR